MQLAIQMHDINIGNVSIKRRMSVHLAMLTIPRMIVYMVNKLADCRHSVLMLTVIAKPLDISHTTCNSLS